MVLSTTMDDLNTIPVKAFYDRDMICANMDRGMSVDELSKYVKELFKFIPTQDLTLKWLDDEGDPCSISSQDELNEAIRLFDVNKEAQLILHVFMGTPDEPGKLCEGETRNIYRRGARRWRKIYKINGHSFVARRFSRLAQCEYCTDIIWGLGRQGYKCLDCRVIVHKKCHRLLRHNCEQIRSQNAAYSSLPSNSAVGKTGKDNETGVKRTKSDSPQRHRKALLQNAYSNSFAASQSQLETSKSHVNVNDFDFIRVIGRGSYAKVIYVTHKKTGRKYAMKIVKKELVNDDEVRFSPFEGYEGIDY